MDQLQLKEGDWVKQKNGTQGMTVTGSVPDQDGTGASGEVKCRFKNAVGETVEETFRVEDLVKI